MCSPTRENTFRPDVEQDMFSLISFSVFDDGKDSKVKQAIESSLLMFGSIVQRKIFMFQHLNK